MSAAGVRLILPPPPPVLETSGPGAVLERFRDSRRIHLVCIVVMALLAYWLPSRKSWHCWVGTTVHGAPAVWCSPVCSALRAPCDSAHDANLHLYLPHPPPRPLLICVMLNPPPFLGRAYPRLTWGSSRPTGAPQRGSCGEKVTSGGRATQRSGMGRRGRGRRGRGRRSAAAKEKREKPGVRHHHPPWMLAASLSSPPCPCRSRCRLRRQRFRSCLAPLPLSRPCDTSTWGGAGA